LGIETPQGQLSYHCPNKYLGLCVDIPRRHPEFDGHTSSDFIKRLQHIAENTNRTDKNYIPKSKIQPLLDVYEQLKDDEGGANIMAEEMWQAIKSVAQKIKETVQ